MSEIFFWGLKFIFMQIPPFVSLCKYGLWSHERTHSIEDLGPVVQSPIKLILG